MKQFKITSIFIILSSFFACEPPVTFDEPQPKDIKNLSKFPPRIQGNYLSLADSSVLQISALFVQRIHDFDQKIHVSQLDSNTQILGDTMFKLTNNSKEIIPREGDSIISHVHYIDTLFKINYDNVVRKFKGYYFLNKRYDKESWEVQKMELSKGKLIISSISDTKDIESLKTITESSEDTVAPYNFTASKKQFKEFIRNNGFSDSETFVKLKHP
jgi:hypothetical protein